MSKELPQPEQQAQKLTPEQFSRVCDSLVDYQVTPDLFIYVNESLEDNRLVVFLLTHQSYFDIEICRQNCEKINQSAENPVSSYLMYSFPAVGKNIGGLLVERKEVYDKCHLNMLGVVRPSDFYDEKYKLQITPEMIFASDVNKKLYNDKTSQGGCISFIPFEATLHSGRVNQKTGDINGMKEVTDNLLLIQAIRQKAIIIPYGVDGSYKIVDPNEHKLSSSFKEAIFLRNPPKIVIAKAGQPMDLSLPKYQGKSTRELYHQATIEVARLVSRQAQGDYRKYIAA